MADDCIVQLPITCPDISTDGIRITKGDTKTIQIALGTDLTGSTVTLYVKRSLTATDVLLTKVGTILPPPTAGNVQFTFVPADTADLPAGFYVFTITVTDSLGGITTVQTGQFTLNPIDQSLVGQVCPIMSLGITGSTERVTLEARDKNGVLGDPNFIQFLVLDFCDNPIVNITSLPDPGITHPEAGIYWYDLTSNRAGDFLAIWTVQFPGEEPIKIIKNVRFVTPAMYRMIPEVLLYIDKSRKATNRPIGFTSIDVAEYISNALRDFNATPPTTQIHLEEISDVYKEVLVMGSIIQALIAQGLLAVDQDFQYNDNGIALTIDHNSKLMGWYQQLLQTYITKKRMYKPNFFQPMAHVRSIVGSTFANSFSKIPAGSASRFRGWI